MAEQFTASTASLSHIETNLTALHDQIETVNRDVGVVHESLGNVYKELEQLAREFHDYVTSAGMQHNLSVAETRLVKVRQELDARYGHYNQVRRTATGILQADDLGIVKKDTISSASEELMLLTPDYWLAPCLVALAAWINDRPELAQKALAEGLRRDQEKTALLFALICRRAGRAKASMKWVRRYFQIQDVNKLDRKCIVMLDAFASGLLGADAEGLITKQIAAWVDTIAHDDVEFVRQQQAHWVEAINAKRECYEDESYGYLRRYSPTWPKLKQAMEGARLYSILYSYFEEIFAREINHAAITAQLDGILHGLVTDFDDEELPLRKSEKFNQLIVDFEGDVARAKSNMLVEQAAYETHKDFAGLLTDAAMRPESSHASIPTQKFAIALSRDWISKAFEEVVVQNGQNVPAQVELAIDDFVDTTVDGSDEEEILRHFAAHNQQACRQQLAKYSLNTFHKFCLVGGAVLALLGVVMAITLNLFLGLAIVLAGLALGAYYYTSRKKVAETHERIQKDFRKAQEKGEQIIRATCAEAVDFWREYSARNAESSRVRGLLADITPEQYIRSLSDSMRRIGVDI